MARQNDVWRDESIRYNIMYNDFRRDTTYSLQTPYRMPKKKIRVFKIKKLTKKKNKSVRR